MVNIGPKDESKRRATAEGKILVGGEVYARIQSHSVKKGDVITVAKLAGIMGAKSTSSLIPLCHNVPLSQVDVDIKFCHDLASLKVTATAEATYKTGVEMECLTAVTITLLTLYDMCKSVNQNMIITGVKLISKTKLAPESSGESDNST